MNTRLWTFTRPAGQPYPLIEPVDKAFIDVRGDFAWTISARQKADPDNPRNKVPGLVLKEKRITTNTIITDIASSIFAGNEVFKEFGADIESSINSAVDLIPEGPGVTRGTQTRLKAFLSKYFSAVENVANTAESSGRRVINEFQSNTDSAFTTDELKPYSYLYLTKPTGFNYTLPYLTDSYNTTDNRFSRGGADSVVGSGIANTANDLASTVAGIGNLLSLKPGTYIERSQQYVFDDEQSKQFEISFPLLNTQDVSDIEANWALLFGLIYQNTPGRLTRSALDLPVIYEVNLPGNFYYPFAYISKLDISFLGTRRVMSVNIPRLDDLTQIETIVPDAYQVNMTIKTLNMPTKNFLTIGLTGNPNKVSVKTRSNQEVI